MKVAKPNKETSRKYTLYLKSLLIKINKMGSAFESSKFKADNNLPSRFMTCCSKLGYIDAHGHGKSRRFFAILDPNEVNESHGAAIAEENLRYNVKHGDFYECPELIRVTSNNKVDLSKSDLNDLIAELRRRGCKGGLKQGEKEFTLI